MTAAVATADLPRIVQTGDPILRRRADPMLPSELTTPAFRELVETMVRVMRAAPGVGLAAPQIGISKQVIVLEDREDYLSLMDPDARRARGRVPLPLTVLVNPTLRLLESEQATFVEGCLSVTGYVALVPRAVEVEVTALDATLGEVTPRVWRIGGWPARILQHEVDHLCGTLYVDRMLSRSLTGPGETHRWTGCTTEEIAASLGVRLPHPVRA